MVGQIDSLLTSQGDSYSMSGCQEQIFVTLHGLLILIDDFLLSLIMVLMNNK